VRAAKRKCPVNACTNRQTSGEARVPARGVTGCVRATMSGVYGKVCSEGVRVAWKVRCKRGAGVRRRCGEGGGGGGGAALGCGRAKVCAWGVRV